MRLKTLITAGIAMLTAGVLSMPADVEAKRFGGGGNLGKQSSSMQRQAQPPQRAPQQQQAQTPQQGQAAAAGQRPQGASGASRWLGPLAGLAAGGLLAAMLFGDGFEGFQALDFLMIVLLAVGAFMLFRMWRRHQARPAMASAGAAAGRGGVTPPLAARRAHPQTDAFAGSSQRGAQSMHPEMAAGTAPPGAGAQDAPAWFDGAAFAEGAKTHFIRLQAAWDKADFRDIRDYTTPQLFAELQRERHTTEGEQYTEVVRLNAELMGVQREDDLLVASVLFSGLIREGEQDVARAFSEIWHVQHAWNAPQGDWLIAGIQQTER